MIDHLCSENRLHPVIQIIYGPSINDLDDSSWTGWVLQDKRYASEEDVYDGEAEAVGDFIFGTTFLINFCPFCGMKLAPTT